MFNIFKKKKKEKNKEEKKESKQELENVEIHSMPNKFRSASGGGHSRKTGLFIMISGTVVLAAAASALVWYIYFSGEQEKKPEQTAVSLPSPAEEPEEGEEATVIEEEAESPEDLAEKECGISLSYLSGGNDEEELIIDYESDSVLSCLGERIIDDCKGALATIKTNDSGELNFRILGKRNDDCLAQIAYPDASFIANSDLKIYAGQHINCFYNLNELKALNYAAGKLADYVYSRSGLDSLTENSQCGGTAFDLWQAETERVKNEEEVAELRLGVDSDGDGLTDVEENTVFVTNANKEDTDDDGYNDKQEVLNSYNPSGEGKLVDSGLVELYNSSNYGYKLFYPKDWRIESQQAGESVFFKSGIDGAVQVLVQEAGGVKGIKAWYAQMAGYEIEEVVQKVEIIGGKFEVIYSTDGLTGYLTKIGGGDTIFVISYSPEESGTIEFAAVFEMMLKSFEVE